MKLQVERKQMAPNKEYQAVKMGGNVVQKSVFDGSKGYQEQMGQKSEMDAEELAEKKAITGLFEQMDYLANKTYKLVAKGTEKVNSSEAYKIEVTSAAGKTITEYYDVKSKMLVKSESAEEGQGGMSINVSTEYGDYRKIGAVMVPYKITIVQSAGGQENVMSMKVTTVKLNEGVTEADFK